MALDLAFFGSEWFFGASKTAADRAEAEMEALRFGTWLPTSLDMQAICVATAGVTSYAVKNAVEIHQRLLATKDEIVRLRFMGHSDGEILALGGTLGDLDAPGAELDQLQGLNAKILSTFKKNLQEATKDKIVDKTDIVIYGCHSGHYSLGRGSELLTAFSAVFGVKTFGFRRALEGCVRIARKEPEPGKRLGPTERRTQQATGLTDLDRVIGRGYFRIAQGKLDSAKQKCTGFVNSLDMLHPDISVPAPASKKNSAKEQSK